MLLASTKAAVCFPTKRVALKVMIPSQTLETDLLLLGKGHLFLEVEYQEKLPAVV